MEIITDTSKYYETVRQNREFFKSYYYHALLDLNLIKLDSILSHGIFSKREIEKRGLPSLYTHQAHDYSSKNGNDLISLSEYSELSILHPMFESFAYLTLSRVSFLINKNITVTREVERESYFDDEVFAKDKISRILIEGILLPDSFAYERIKRINPLPNDLSCFTKKYLFHWLKCMETYFELKIPEHYIFRLKDSYETLWKILSNYGSPEKWFNLGLEKQREEKGEDLRDVLAIIFEYLWSLKFNIDNPTYIEILNLLNKDKLPVYIIEEKTLRKIN